MKCKILHTSRGRMRVHLCLARMSLREADVLEYYLRAVDGVTGVQVFDRTCDAIITYTAPRDRVTRALATFSFANAEAMDLVPEHTSRAINREYEDKLMMSVATRMASKLFLPMPVRSVIAVFRAVRYIKLAAARQAIGGGAGCHRRYGVAAAA